MSGSRDWYGKPPKQGLEQRVMEFFRGNPGIAANSRTIAQHIRHPNADSVNAAMSVLYREGWLSRDGNVYRLAAEEPIEDPARVITPSYTVSNRGTRRASKNDGIKPGSEYLIKCIAFDEQGRLLIQEEDSRYVYRATRI